MAIGFLDVCRFLATSGGAGDFIVASAVTGYQTPASAGAVNGPTYRYRAESSDLSQWEVGYGTYSVGTLTRATILFSSNGNAKVSFSSAPQVAVVLLAEDALSSQNNLSDLSNAAAARTSLGLGGAATLNVGTIAGTVAAGDDARITGALQKTANLSDLTSVTAALANLGLSSIRTVLTASKTFYVSTTGNDSNDGLTPGTPWLTIQHAYDVLRSTLDFGGFTVVIQLADGTYASGITISTAWLGGGQLTINGNIGSPANVVISPSFGPVNVSAPLAGKLNIQNLKVSAALGTGINLQSPGTIQITNVIFGACAAYQVLASGPGAFISCATYSITGGASANLFALSGGSIAADGATVLLVGTPAFSVGFAYASRVASISAGGMGFTGSATGPRYSIDTNAVIYTGGGGANYFPGSTPGSSASGGQYV